MSTISVVTAVDPRRAEHLATTWNSLASQVMPPGWSWEWLVQCDSTDPDDQQIVRQHLPAHPQISFAASRHGGPGIARTMTLARARGRLIKTLDADDRLTEGALARDIRAHSNPGVLWSAPHVVNEYPDGRRENHYPWDPPAGRIQSGTAYAAYKQGWRILVHPATLCIRYPILLALGGWMALPASEDTALLMALDACGDGFFIPETGMIYRRWSPQMSASAQHVEPYELDARRTLVLQRAEAVSDWVAGRANEVAGVRTSPSAPATSSTSPNPWAVT
jgi:glycosyltransferase involved in cell wall biosynthesis